VAIATVIAMEPDHPRHGRTGRQLDQGPGRSVIGLLNSFAHLEIVASHDSTSILDVCADARDPGRCDRRDGSAPAILSDATLLAENNLELPLTLQGRHAGDSGAPMSTPRP